MYQLEGNDVEKTTFADYHYGKTDRHTSNREVIYFLLKLNRVAF